MYQPARLRRILVPTDFSERSDVAFAHALRLALAFQGDLSLFHVEPKNDRFDWRWAPQVLDTLKRWGVLDAPATESALEGLRIQAHRTASTGVEPDRAILDEIAASHADLVVMATHGRAGVERWLQPSVAEAVLRRNPVPVLLVPAGRPGFVNAGTGEATLSRVLVPIDVTPNPAPAFDAAVQMLRALGDGKRQIATFHVGKGHPDVELLRPDNDCEVFNWTAEGNVVDEIVSVATTWRADLVVAVSEGQRSFLDELRGSTVERLVAQATCPVLVVPADWGAPGLSG